MERRFLAELRALEDGDNPSIIGVVVRYGAEAELPGFRERFLPGAFGNVSALDVVANLQHDRGRPIARSGGGGLELRDSADSLSATVVNYPLTQDAKDAIALIRAGVLQGFSIEFTVPAGGDKFVGSLRTISEARLTGLALVDRPAYGDSLAKVAQRALAAPTDGGDSLAYRPWELS